MVEGGKFGGVSHGLSHAGYDIRVAEDHYILPGTFRLASSLEQFNMPNYIVGFVHGKSTWARRGLLVHNTVIEPGWRGFLTIELWNGGKEEIDLRKGMGIVQVIFHFMNHPTDDPYLGKYQDQKAGPQPAILEVEHDIREV